MANTHKTLADVEVVAFKFDPTDDPMPAILEADGNFCRDTDTSMGWKVKTNHGYMYPDDDDWVVVYSTGEVFLIDDAIFTVMFTAL